MGIRNLGVSLFGAIQARVLSVFRNFDDQYCTVGELIDYCTERGKIPLLDEHASCPHCMIPPHFIVNILPGLRDTLHIPQFNDIASFVRLHL